MPLNPAGAARGELAALLLHPPRARPCHGPRGKPKSDGDKTLDAATECNPVKAFWVKMGSSFVTWAERGFLGNSFRSNKVNPRGQTHCASAWREGALQGAAAQFSAGISRSFIT